MKTHVINTYTFDELSPQAKEKALRWAGNTLTDLYGWHDENVQSLKAFAKWLGAKFDYSIQGGGYGYSWAKVTLADNYITMWVEENKEYQEFELAELTGEKLYEWLQGDEDKITDCCPFTGYCMDEDLLDPMREYLAKSDPDDPRTLQDLVNEGCERWVKSYVADWDWAYSDEGLKDFLTANEYQFTEDGKTF